MIAVCYILLQKADGLIAVCYIILQEADVMIAPTAVDPGRESAADFIQPYYWEDTVLLVKLLDDSGINFVLLFGVFSYEIIVAVALVLPLVIVLMFVVEKYSPYNTIYKPGHKLNLPTVALDFYGILFAQGKHVFYQHM